MRAIAIRELLAAYGAGALAVFRAYFDESETQAMRGQNLPDDAAFTIGGFVASAEKIAQFEIEWDAMLKELEIPWFHMTDIVSGRDSDFRKFRTSEFSLYAQKRAAEIIESINPSPIVFSVRLADWREASPTFSKGFSERYARPYAVVYEMVIQAIELWLSLHPNDEISLLTMSQNSELEGVAGDVPKAYSGHSPSRKLFRNIIFGFPNRSPALQAADCIAYEVNQIWTTNTHAPHHQVVRPISELIRPKKDILFQRYVRKDALLKMAAKFDVVGRI